MGRRLPPAAAQLRESAGDITFGEGQDVDLKGLAGVNRVYAVV